MVLKVPVVEKSCCGVSLETGTKIIGFLHVFIIGGLFLTASVLYVIDQYKRFSRGGIIFNDTFNAAFFRDDFLHVTVFGNLAFSACLLYGTFKRDSVYFEPWLVLKTSDIACSIFNVGVILVVRIFGHKLLDIFFQLIYAGLESYMFIVVYSLYKEIKAVPS